VQPWLVFLTALIGYFLGSISFSRVITRHISASTNLQDVVITNKSTGETFKRRPTAAAVSMALGWKNGCLVSLLDMLKVTLPVLAVKWLMPDQPYFLITAAMAVVGNNWPIFYRFKGGAGISAIYGGLLAIDPFAIFVPALVGLVVGMLIFRSFMVMFLLSVVLIVPWMAYRYDDPAFWIYGLVVGVMYLINMAVDAAPYIRSEGKIMKEREVMEQMPMGRAMLKMMERMRFPWAK
jgi:glycerol-3-phosphate acyltransferase PlsY